MAEAGAGGTIAALPVDAGAFGYVCRQCNRCCRDKKIQINPYEVSRLATALHISAQELRARFTLDGKGEYLARKEDGTCVFLSWGGCTVHEGRPLVCRLYPLGRTICADGSESYSVLAGHPESAGTVSRNGTVPLYLERQGALPFIAAADAYFRWYCAALDRGITPAAPQDETGTPEDLLDMDLAAERQAARTGRALPNDPNERLSLHLDLLYDLLADSGGPEASGEEGAPKGRNGHVNRQQPIR